jgi:ABC-type transporter Mla subunit MlaD
MNGAVKWLVMLLALTACEKPDTAGAYRGEAVALEAYYRPVLDAFSRRIDTIRERGQSLRDPVPGADDTGATLKSAFQGLSELHALIDPGPDGKSALDKRIATAGDDSGALAKLADETRAKLESGAATIAAKLSAVEAWEAEAEAELKLHPAPADQAATPL